MSKVYISKINSLASADPKLLVSTAEQKYKNFTLEIATRVAENKNIRIILLAGPSGSGKTTTANLLADSLRGMGIESFVLSLDNFYLDGTDERYPRFENGERDYESVDALDISLLESVLANIASGRDFSVPKYDFKVGKRVSETPYPKMPNGCVIIEGLHALNPVVFENLPKEKILKIFISVSTNVICDENTTLSGRKIRFVRRMIRDSLYRGAEAERTVEMWGGVLAGEDKYLYPFRGNADIQFDTFHAFELGVMSKYVKRLITDELAKSNEYAATVASAVGMAVPVDESLVPQDSLIREFITGGIYEEFY